MKRTSRSPRVKRWLFVCFVIIGSFVYSLFQGGFVSWFLFYASVSVILLSCTMSFLSLWGMKTTRVMSASELPCFAQVDVELSICKRRLLPSFCYEIVDRVPQKLCATGARAFLYPALKKQVSFSYCVEANARGQHEFPAVDVMVHDLFGLLTLKRTIPVKTTLLVYPAYRQLAQFSSADVTAETTVKWLQQQEEYAFAGIRAYEPGDRLARVDWKHSAGVSGLFTKMFETAAHKQALVIALPYAGYAHAEATSVRFEQAVSTVASITSTLMREQIALSLWTYERAWQSQAVTASSWTEALRTLALLEYSPTEETSPVDLLHCKEATVVFFVVPLYTHMVLQFVRTCRDSGHQVYVTVIDRLTAEAQAELEEAGAIIFQVLLGREVSQRA